jgi:hypothetical protein
MKEEAVSGGENFILGILEPNTQGSCQSGHLNEVNMDRQYQATQSNYDPNKLLNTINEKLRLRNDAALSRTLEVSPPVISKIRHKRLPLGASVLIRMHEVSGLSIRELRALMGDRRQSYRVSDSAGKATLRSQLGQM